MTRPGGGRRGRRTSLPVVQRNVRACGISTGGSRGQELLRSRRPTPPAENSGREHRSDDHALAYVIERILKIFGQFLSCAHHGESPAQYTGRGAVPRSIAIEQQIAVPQRVVALRK